MMGEKQTRHYQFPHTKRDKCPHCGKKGLGKWRFNWASGDRSYYRSCQYCQTTQTRRQTDENP